MRRFANRIATLFGVVILSGGYLYAQTVAISPGYVNLPLGGTQQFKATVTGLSPATVTWSVTAGGGSITQTGLYTAPSTLPKNSVLVSATSTANRKISAVVYVNPEGPGPTINAISPNPAPVGTDTITITANASAPFIKGATAVCNGAEASAKFISSTSVGAVNDIDHQSVHFRIVETRQLAPRNLAEWCLDDHIGVISRFGIRDDAGMKICQL